MKRLSTATKVKQWREEFKGTLADYHQEIELARGQLIVEKLEGIVELYLADKSNEPSAVLGMAVKLLKDPEGVDVGPR